MASTKHGSIGPQDDDLGVMPLGRVLQAFGDLSFGMDAQGIAFLRHVEGQQADFALLLIKNRIVSHPVSPSSTVKIRISGPKGQGKQELAHS